MTDRAGSAEQGDPRRVRDRVARAVRDPAAPGLAAMALMMVAGSVGILLAYGGTARTIYVPLQVPEAISGGLGGLALIGLGAVLVSVQLARRDAAREREASDEVLGEMAEVMAVAPKLQSIVRRRRGLPDPPAPPASDGGMRADDATDPGG